MIRNLAELSWPRVGFLAITLFLMPKLHEAKAEDLPQAKPNAQEVKIENFTFVPDHLTVKAGTTVTFENDDDIPHLVVADDKSFRSAALDTGDKYTLTLTKPGDFPYFCGMHPHMQGKITVVP